jgi:ribosomal protein S27AE
MNTITGTRTKCVRCGVRMVVPPDSEDNYRYLCFRCKPFY